jgi:glycosyltransferase involved in cell wall biosynthesis
LDAAARRLQAWVRELEPDLIHAMRIPYEGMLAARVQAVAPLLVSIWGNDFTLHARSTPRMARLTRETLKHASAIHADCQRDIRLAREWGFPVERPTVVLPGAGGVQPELFFPPAGKLLPDGALWLEKDPIVINPRGVRAYVRNDTFFQAVRRVIDQRPGVHFICPGMAGNAQMLRWVRELRLDGHVSLLPLQTRAQMAGHFQQALVAVSPSIHDGTPNTLLEAMACACFPIVGDMESLREWIVPGVNGMLVDPGDPAALADAILLALDQRQLRWRAGQLNQQLIAERAAYPVVMSKALSFYDSLAAKVPSSR